MRPFVLGDLDDADRLLTAVWGALPDGRIGRERWLRWAIENERMLVELWQPPYGDRAVIRREDGRLVGVVGLVPALGPFGQLPGFPGHHGSSRWFPEVGLYWAIDPAEQGKGYATEAARGLIDAAVAQFQLGRVIATTEFGNLASRAVMRKLGMTILTNPEPEPVWLQVVGVLEFA